MILTKEQCYGILLIRFVFTSCSKNGEDKTLGSDSEIEVRSVLLSCELGEMNELTADSELMRFQREEFLKHNLLQNCKKKLAVTLKFNNKFDETAADEYIPIEHVLSARNKRIRLLNPYVLRLRREPAYQVFKLRKLETVTGFFSNFKKMEKENNLERDIYSDDIGSQSHYIESNTSYAESDDIDTLNVDKKSNGNTNFRKINDVLKIPSQIRNRKNNASIYSPKMNCDYVLYEIGNPNLWNKAQVQLYEKLNTPDGKIIWNDLTKLQSASISTIDPAWKNEDLSIQYGPSDFIKTEDLSLPPCSLCLVLPMCNSKEPFAIEDESISNDGEYIIVPKDDVIIIKSNERRTSPASSEDGSHDSIISNRRLKPQKRQVVIRTTRTIMAGLVSDLNITAHGSDQYLKLPHKLPTRGQINLEARADDNKLVIVGSSGRLTSIVSDNYDGRTILNLLVMNSGLAPSYFSVVSRDCNPHLSGAQDYKTASCSDSSEKVLIPPMHSEDFVLEVPSDILFENFACSILLLNGDGEPVASRDVKIKREDRCFCVWHCQCVCLSDDPKLICQPMPEAELTAAGLTTQQSIRHTRSVCYPDVLSVNLFVVVIGVLLLLFLLGIIKAILGIIFPCIGSWGIVLLLKMPRKLDHYFESSLRCRPVVYDKDGWPVHPDSKKRTVLLVSRSMEFILNVIIFITLPCVLLWDALIGITSKCQRAEGNIDGDYKSSSTKRCFSTHDIQVMEPKWRRHKSAMRKWMTPQAEELSTEIWMNGLSPTGVKAFDGMQPLLNGISSRNELNNMKDQKMVNSEQDDTEYVLMQIRKSKESLSFK